MKKPGPYEKVGKQSASEGGGGGAEAGGRELQIEVGSPDILKHWEEGEGRRVGEDFHGGVQQAPQHL